MPPGLKQLKADKAIREFYKITDQEIEVASTSRFYGGGEDKFTPEQWVDLIKVIREAGIV
ncbi:MAG TPA: hypothetical protein PKV71_11385 [Calditrichia bacterium]|nr:hypothetical protein [Calditrichia bacterium]HQV32474.1 hypothetical protein [Calditrichia bacterium]